MNEQEFRNALEQVLNERINRDIMFTPTGSKDAVVTHHVQWVKNHSGDNWDDAVALQRFNEFKSGMESDLTE